MCLHWIWVIQVLPIPNCTQLVRATLSTTWRANRSIIINSMLVLSRSLRWLDDRARRNLSLELRSLTELTPQVHGIISSATTSIGSLAIIELRVLGSSTQLLWIVRGLMPQRASNARLISIVLVSQVQINLSTDSDRGVSARYLALVDAFNNTLVEEVTALGSAIIAH